MRLLSDTHLLLWAAGQPEKLSRDALSLLDDRNNQLVFSAVSLWEIAIKNTLGRTDFRADPRLVRRSLLDNGWEELLITGAHAVAVSHLPPLHRDPFDRMLVAQAETEGIMLLTADAIVAQYPGPIRLV